VREQVPWRDRSPVAAREFQALDVGGELPVQIDPAALDELHDGRRREELRHRRRSERRVLGAHRCLLVQVGEPVTLGQDHALSIYDHDHGAHQVPARHLLLHHASEIALEHGVVDARASCGQGAARKGQRRDEQCGENEGRHDIDESVSSWHGSRVNRRRLLERHSLPPKRLVPSGCLTCYSTAGSDGTASAETLPASRPAVSFRPRARFVCAPGGAIGCGTAPRSRRNGRAMDSRSFAFGERTRIVGPGWCGADELSESSRSAASGEGNCPIAQSARRWVARVNSYATIRPTGRRLVGSPWASVESRSES
jgi:hypothetical protein